jgi:hypothetical protein
MLDSKEIDCGCIWQHAPPLSPFKDGLNNEGKDSFLPPIPRVLELLHKEARMAWDPS